MRYTTFDFITKANLIHNNTYTYNKTKYIGARKKLIITCRIHGDFEQIACNHLSGKGCPYCGNRFLITTEEYIKKAKQVHGDRYDYSLVNYKNNHTPIDIICPIHGVFKQNPASHLKGHKCAKCTGNNKLNTQEFIEKCKLIHNNFYDYSKVNYKNNNICVNIECPKHGEFQQKPRHHLNGHGCPKCSGIQSKGEKEIVEYIKSIYSGLILENNRKVLNGKELDIYLPELNLAIEYNGEYWHNLIENKNPGYHKEKAKLCKEKGIKLINISDKEWLIDKEKIKVYLSDMMNVTD